MMDILYNVFIFPIEQIIGLCYVFAFRIFKDPALSILGVSFAISVLLLPFYFMAEKYQLAEQEIKKKLKPVVDNIKAVFSGNERFMRTAIYYRQNGYHPIYALRSSFSLFIQIPFFIAAYHYLANLEVIHNVSFGPIADLAKPDSLLTIRGFTINILPIAMALINCVSAAVYAKGFAAKDKFQLYGIAAIFLLLLYNSPSGLVIYWTCNNIFSLCKNVIQKTKYPKRFVHVLISVACLLLVVFVLFFHEGMFMKRIFIAVIFTCIPLFPFVFKILSTRIKQVFRKQDNNNYTDIFILSLLTLFLLGGLVIPSSLIASSVQEFSFIEHYKSPFPFIISTTIQSFGIFILWPLLIYFMFSQTTKRLMAKISVILVGIAIVNVFLFVEYYGHLSTMFKFSEEVESSTIIILLNLFIIFFIAILISLFMGKLRKILVSGLTIAVFALMLSGTMNCINIFREFHIFQLQLIENSHTTDKPIYRFSKNGKNVLIIMLDMGMPGYLPYIFDEKPELNNSFDGFTWYRNTISFGPSTIFGVPGIFGGYEYTPLEMQNRNDTPLVEKHNEALLLLPKIFSDHGFEVFVSDPPLANYSWIPDLRFFSDYPQINANNILGKFTNQWLLDRKIGVDPINMVNHINFNMIRFSLFKFAPIIFRGIIYDDGDWLSCGKYNKKISNRTLKNYIALDILPEITVIDDTELDCFNVFSNELPHASSFLQPPDYVPAIEITNIGNGFFANDEYYHVILASFLLLEKWFDFLKENNVYDNTKIIIVSDHGRNLRSKFPNNIILPDNRSLQQYSALLLVKDFCSHGKLSVDDSFMTNADVPLLALNGIVENPVNPWTGKILSSNKENGITLTTSELWSTKHHFKYQFDIKPHEWLHVRDNIFEVENWEMKNISIE